MATTLKVLENTMWSLHLEGKALCVPAAPIHIPSFPGAARRPPPHGLDTSHQTPSLEALSLPGE